LASLNYNFDQRYILDATYRLDGSTAFGSKHMYSPFWSVGIGWNINNEKFLDYDFINTLRIKANIGMTGNQNFGAMASSDVYNFNQQTGRFGQAIYLSQLGNPNLEWQKTREVNLGLNLVMFSNRISLTVNAYQKYSDPLVSVINLASSTGVTGYDVNTGDLDTRGIEATFKISPIHNLSKRVIWTIGVMGSRITSKFGGFGNRLSSLNKEMLENSSLFRFVDGHSPNDIWTVKSLGIDPITGNELFLAKDGDPTFKYDNKNRIVVGNSRPDLQGVISSNFTYKNFVGGVYFKYSVGSDKLNHALYNKVENISSIDRIYNHDVRALTERWHNPGDITPFKNISNSGTTPISSRFLQRLNYIELESLHIGYRVNSKTKWLNKLGFNSLRINLNLNNIYRISSVKRERGIDYPFAKTISTSIYFSF
jgi:outer membrane receptor protein involved in Fe transport